MKEKGVKATPTTELISLVAKAMKNGEQDLVNIYAYELACRIYVPNHTESFEDLLLKFGYQDEILNKKR